MLTLVGGQVECLRDEVLPVEVRGLPDDLARLDRVFGRLSLLDLAGGTDRGLARPSYFANIVRVVPEPHGPLVAVDFGSPAFPGPAQTEDIWMLDTTTGTFTHLPAYPAQVDIKFSSVAWTGDDRLVIVAQGGGRTVLGLWKPGQATLPLRGLPNRSSGYYSSVPLVG
jgi:hypothetical protein